ncbi:MAG: hypothetical protein OCC49_05480 [Fibrobacterales bacterium]
MIEINLLKQDALASVAQELGEDLSHLVSDSVASARKNKRLMILASITIVAWIIIIFAFAPVLIQKLMAPDVIEGSLSTESVIVEMPIDEIGLKDVSKPLPQISINEENVVEEIVMGMRQSIEQKKKKPIPKLLDFEKIKNQKLMMYTTLKRVGDAASLKVTFGKVVIKIPGYYYLHGLASDPLNYRQFKKALKSVSSKFKENPVKNVGLVGNTQEFNLYGSVKHRELNERKVTFVAKDQIKNLNRNLIDVAENMRVSVQNLEKKRPRALHGYRSYSYTLMVSSGFNDLTRFVQTLHQKKIPVGILQLSVVPTVDQKMNSTLDLVYYVKE